MYDDTYMYAIERSPEYLAHYGVRGMRWGVRKAIQSGNARRLGRQYAKAQKKLAKLEKRANSGKKYARRAALLGAGAAAAGGLAAAGTAGVGRLASGAGNAMREIGYGTSRLAGRYIKNGKIRGALQTAGRAVGTAGGAVVGTQNKINAWGRGTSMSDAARTAITKNQMALALQANKKLGVGNAVSKGSFNAAQQANGALKGVSNNTIARIGAGVIGAGLAGAAGYNAYRAATTKRAAKKAAQFRSEMNKAFKGTQYANGGSSQPRQGKKRRRNG